MFVCECVYFHVHVPGWQGTVWKPSLPATVPLGGKSADQSFGNTTTPTPSSGCKTCTDTHAHKLFSLWHYLTSVQQGVGLQLTTFLHVCRGLGWMALLIISKQQLSHQKTHCFSQIDVSHAGLWSQTPCPSTQKCVFFFFFLSLSCTEQFMWVWHQKPAFNFHLPEHLHLWACFGTSQSFWSHSWFRVQLK